MNDRVRIMNAEAEIMEQACEYCRWPLEYSDESLYEEKCDGCMIAKAVRKALGIEEEIDYPRCPHCGGMLSKDRGGYVHCYACHFEFALENL